MTWRRSVATLAVCGAAALSGCASRATHQAATHLDTIRFGVITSGGGAELPEALIRTGIAAKYGLRIQIVPYAAPGQQYTLVRGGGADIVPGNVLDLQRQRLADAARTDAAADPCHHRRRGRARRRVHRAAGFRFPVPS